MSRPLALLVWLVAALSAAPLAAAPQTAIRRAAPAESRPDLPAPDFELRDSEGGTFRLSQACAEGYVLLVFVRGMR